MFSRLKVENARGRKCLEEEKVHLGNLCLSNSLQVNEGKGAKVENVILSSLSNIQSKYQNSYPEIHVFKLSLII
jgi:hypothetical protein